MANGNMIQTDDHNWLKKLLLILIIVLMMIVMILSGVRVYGQPRSSITITEAYHLVR